ncbi:MAG: hypothetical protein HY222_02640 [Thaumarchaeota archaeon]|nr:hypothetical protein [Nitrososphaerota archaeon]MBI3641272.1 hypothetical protein [Nitrososphaerota archaeon]
MQGYIHSFSSMVQATVMIYEEVSIEEMWKVIESFGIDRKMLERINPDNHKIKDLYKLIKSKKIVE